MKELLNKKIKQIFIDSEYQTYLKFVVENSDSETEEICYYGDGDCCSETYFAEVLGVNIFDRYHQQFHYTVTDVELMNLGSGEGTRQESDAIYGYRIRTEVNMKERTTSYGDHHTILVIFRNSSNGYYGGSCQLAKVIPEKTKMVEITKDYRA